MANAADFLREMDTLLEQAPGTAHMETELGAGSSWDSMAALSFMAMVDEQYGISIKPAQLGACKTIGDLYLLVSGPVP